MMYLTSEDAARQLHMTEDSVRRLAAEGKLPARKVGRRWLFHPELLDKYMRNEWHSTSVKPGEPGGSDSLLAARQFDEAAVLEIESSPRNTRPRFGNGTSGSRN